MNLYQVKKILTTCPHCFNTLKNEYPQFGGHFEVLHYTEVLADFITKGRLRPVREIEKSIVYHDSCYLGRYNDVYDAPRRILRGIPGLQRVELKRNMSDSFCCGAGGGRMWMEELIGQRINEVRTREILEQKPDIIGTACPYCLTMFEDGIKAEDADEKVVARDILEVLAQSMT